MFLIDVCPEHLDQGRIINRKRFSIRSLNIDNELCEVGQERIRVSAFRLDQVDGSRRFVWIPEAWTILQKFSLFARCEIWESLVIRRTPEGKDAIAIDSRVTGKDFI
jgi:hypothetical protein